MKNKLIPSVLCSVLLISSLVGDTSVSISRTRTHSFSWSREKHGYYLLKDVRHIYERSDSSGRIKERIEHTKGGKPYLRTEYFYNEKGLTGSKTFFPDDSLQAQSRFVYKKGSVQEWFSDSKGDLVRLIERKTDASGRLVQMDVKSRDSILLRSRKYFYDDAGHLVSTVLYDPLGKPMQLSFFQYDSFDSNGYWTVRDEEQIYSDVQYGTPKERLVRSVSNAGVYQAQASSPEAAYPEVSVQVFLDMTQRLSKGSGPGAKVLARALEKITAKTIIKGSCYDWINLVYKEEGFSGDKRKTVFWGKETGPYADPLLLQPGDWIMFKNQTYGDIVHSGIFLGWLDYECRSAIVIGYAGQNRTMPGRFREYDITRLFGVVRGVQ